MTAPLPYNWNAVNADLLAAAMEEDPRTVHRVMCMVGHYSWNGRPKVLHVDPEAPGVAV